MFKFLEGLDKDIQQSLLNQLRDLWTHTSTALEGNTLTLGDTQFVLGEGLTVSGKPLKDHQEVVGHARAIELIYAMVGRNIEEKDIFELHKAVQTEEISDIYKPYGAWKIEPNGTYVVDESGKQIYIEYAQPRCVPALMKELVARVNEHCSTTIELDNAPKIYAEIHMGIAHIHPFWDGNGRIARLLANLPLLSSGMPPIVIKKEERRDYIIVLSRYQQEVGVLTKTSGVWPQNESLEGFVELCRNAYAATQQLIDNAKALQTKRNLGSGKR
jgi:Fic family protein